MDYRKYSRTKNAGMPVEQRFWEKVDKRGPDECWEWQGAKQMAGYGVLRVDDGTVRAHRLSYELANGPVQAGVLVCHKCDNPPCVNPRHLFLGSYADNAHDAMGKGRTSKPPRHFGEAHHNAKLTPEKVREIRHLRTVGVSQSECARRFGVHKSSIKDIDSGRTWAHVS